MIDPTQIETRYAKSGELHIAYQQFGNGDTDLVLIPGWASHVEQVWNFHEAADFLQRLARFARVLLIDRRGTGLSDPVLNMPTLEERMDDIRAVMDHAGIDRASLFGISEGGPLAIVFAASFPERTDRIVLFGTFARLVTADGYPIGSTPDAAKKFVDRTEQYWGSGNAARIFAPSRANDPAFVKAFGRFERHAMGPGAARRLIDMNFQIDVRDVLSAVQSPTIVLHRSGDSLTPIALGRYLGERISGARFVELPGEDHLFCVGDLDRLLAEVEHFLTGAATTTETERILATIMFADIASSTETAAAIGDREWKHLLERFYAAARDSLSRFRGRELDTAGDGLFAAFDGPARAVRCAMALRDAVQPLGFQLRAGVHTGECEAIGQKLGGIAVHIGARIAAKAQPGEVLASATVKALTVGAGLNFTDRGAHTLKGIEEPWQLYLASS